eukprot:8804478-Ditylum_brightwellii.AAC.1
MAIRKSETSNSRHQFQVKQWFKANAQTLELAGGEHIFYGEQLEGSSLSNDDKKKAIERFKAVLFLKRLDSTRYGELLDSIDEGSNLGCDEYPENLASAFDLI